MQTAVSIRAGKIGARRIRERARRLSSHHLAIGDGQEFRQADGIQRVESGDSNAQGELIGSKDVAVHQIDGGFEAIQDGAAGLVRISMGQDGKFIAAETGDDVGLTKSHFQNFGAANQKRIPLNMPALVVDLFQAVDICEEKEERLRRTERQTDIV